MDSKKKKKLTSTDSLIHSLLAFFPLLVEALMTPFVPADAGAMGSKLVAIVDSENHLVSLHVRVFSKITLLLPKQAALCGCCD